MVRRLEDRCDEKRERKGQECAQEGASATRLSGRLCVQYPALEPGLGKTMGVIGSYSAPPGFRQHQARLVSPAPSFSRTRASLPPSAGTCHLV